MKNPRAQESDSWLRSACTQQNITIVNRLKRHRLQKYHL